MDPNPSNDPFVLELVVMWRTNRPYFGGNHPGTRSCGREWFKPVPATSHRTCVRMRRGRPPGFGGVRDGITAIGTAWYRKLASSRPVVCCDPCGILPRGDCSWGVEHRS